MKLIGLCSVALFLVAGGANASAEAAKTQPTPASFGECVAQQGKVTKGFIAQCVSKEGNIYLDEAGEFEARTLCEDLCGDGTCQEIVCLSLGCPCAEDHQSCPQDCK